MLIADEGSAKASRLLQHTVIANLKQSQAVKSALQFRQIRDIHEQTLHLADFHACLALFFMNS